jgi:para-nitrobenzyl esterase
MSVRGFTAEEATAVATDLLTAAGLKPDQIDQLAAMPFDQLVAVQMKLKTRGGAFKPVVDGGVMPRQPFDPDAPSISTNIPLLVGSNATEMTLLIGAADPSAFTITWDDLPKRLAPILAGDDAAAIIADMRRRHPDYSASDMLFRIGTWRRYRKTAIAEAERKADRGGAPVYMYLLDWRTPVEEESG